MTLPHQVEGNANNVLGNLLRPMMGKASVFIENTRVIRGSSGKHPDILITASGRSPVVIEAEYYPAIKAEAEARERLGMPVAEVSRPIEAVIALRYPSGLESSYDQLTAITSNVLSYCVLTVERYGPIPDRAILEVNRYPESGWLTGTVEDLANSIRLVSSPQLAVDDAADMLQGGIESASVILNELSDARPAISSAIARLLDLDDVPQARRMAAAIIANAMVFHERIAGMHEGIKTLDLVCSSTIPNPKGETLDAWAKILEIDYWAVFAIGRRILQQIPPAYAARILDSLFYRVEAVSTSGIDNSHDLTGRVFQRLVSDRKYLATFYTLPASAALLARLAVAKMEGIDWGDVEAIGNLKVGDFACGTGALLSAVYEQIAAKHETAGGDATVIHKAMMEDVMYGCDVLPSAVHITASTLAGLQPEISYGNSRLYPLPYGRKPDGSVKIGSLELLQSSSVEALFYTSDPAQPLGSEADETAVYIDVEIPDQGFDLVIMNPPFTRNTTNEGETAETYAGAFAAFGNSLTVQEEMADRLKQMASGTVYHGNAGIASAFASLATGKLKPGGVVGLVMPLSLASGTSWVKFRQMLAKEYTDLEVISLSANSSQMAFSSDTGMADCVLVARKLVAGEQPIDRARFISLPHRPKGLFESDVLSRAILSLGESRLLEDGPFGGTPIRVGNAISGESLIAGIREEGAPWGAVRLNDIAVAQTAYAITQGRLALPGLAESWTLSIVPLREFGQRGLYHLDIRGAPPRGPFDVDAPSVTATYPSLWNHHATQEKRMIVAPDRQLRIRQGMEAKAQLLWQTISRSHINAEFTFGSQALGVAFTENRTMGGRVWPTVGFADQRFDFAFALWGNSTLGLLSYWWHSSRQQSSKASMTIRQADTLPVLDFRALSDDQLATAERIFNEFRELDLMPAYLADADPNRALLDRRVICDLLGFDEDIYRGVRRLAQKWCAEPSVHGGKARPKSAVYVE